MTAPLDWADELAAEILIDVARAGPMVAGLIAARLRLNREEGVAAGIKQANDAVDAIFGRPAA